METLFYNLFINILDTYVKFFLVENENDPSPLLILFCHLEAHHLDMLALPEYISSNCSLIKTRTTEAQLSKIT